MKLDDEDKPAPKLYPAVPAPPTIPDYGTIILTCALVEPMIYFGLKDIEGLEVLSDLPLEKLLPI